MALIDADPFSRRVIGSAIEVHRTLGPGLLESIYELCLCEELTHAGIAYERQVPIPVAYKGKTLDAILRADLIVEDRLLLEIKSLQAVLPVHEAQLLTYLKLSGLSVGLMLNFNVSRLIDGIRRRLL